jgi:hypothetical protein
MLSHQESEESKNDERRESQDTEADAEVTSSTAAARSMRATEPRSG